jgi:hypothetical protein
MVHFVTTLINEHSPVTREHFDQVIRVVKVHYIATCVLLVLELEWRFLDHELMNVFEIIYPHYWLQLDCESTFVDHFTLIKDHYCIAKKVGTNGKWVSEPLSRDVLDLHSFLFKLTMKNQATKAMVELRDENLMTRLWC